VDDLKLPDRMADATAIQDLHIAMKNLKNNEL